MVALTDCPQIPARASDEFMIYQFKVLPCTRKRAHSWTECAFTHPGEKAARRCPKSFIYSAEACPDARKSGKCIRGDMCPYSHGVFEQWLHPSRYRTQLCSFGTACRRPVCFFAHTVQELRVPTGCGPNPQAITSPMQAGAAAAAAAAASQMGLDPSAVAAAAAAAASQGMDGNSYNALMQQAMLAQMSQAAAMSQHVDGATATLINRYQAASCAALANAAACQREQQQHQAAAAVAAAAAMAAASSNPASLLQMAQAAQAYQAAAAAAAAAAASIHAPNGGGNGMMPPGMNFAGMSNPGQLMTSSGPSTSSAVSSPTCSSSNSHNTSLMSASTVLGDMQNAAAAEVAASMSRQASANCPSLFDSYLLQQAMAGAACNPGACSPFGGLPPTSLAAAAAAASAASPGSGASMFGAPWMPCASGGFACGPYPSPVMPATPANSNGMEAYSAAQLTRQLSLQQQG
uniref:C3H1-type domain-containing protein n=1 Tax=Tetradesmus obliquus TaxID=3088 RepID=A0A383VJ97_TETOB|eukprot:jgi/Sobl393_1/9353/SZX64899.1